MLDKDDIVDVDDSVNDIKEEVEKDLKKDLKSLQDLSDSNGDIEIDQLTKCECYYQYFTIMSTDCIS